MLSAVVVSWEISWYDALFVFTRKIDLTEQIRCHTLTECSSPSNLSCFKYFEFMFNLKEHRLHIKDESINCDITRWHWCLCLCTAGTCQLVRLMLEFG